MAEQPRIRDASFRATGREQDKQKEIAFFDRHAEEDEYDVFTPASSARLIDAAVRLIGLAPPAKMIDLGCGSGAFTHLLQRAGYACVGLDISGQLLRLARRRYPGIEFVQGDIEHLPFADGSFDAALLSGVVHHLPDPSRCAAETFRILRPYGRFVAFDPNRMNPFMWLYRDPSSPFYSSVGVTENERPVLGWQVREIFCNDGFRAQTDYIAGLAYRYVASQRTQRFLPLYNLIDRTVFTFAIMKPFRPFVLVSGEKVS